MRRWIADTLTPGRTYRFTATAPTRRRECPTGSVTHEVTIPQTGVDTVSINARDCAPLSLRVRYDNPRHGQARYTINALDFARSDTISTRSQRVQVLVPIGNYQLRVSAPFCVDYRSPHSIFRTDSMIVSLICGTGS
jgi:hypothetical protein